jgi:hypothetical protein
MAQLLNKFYSVYVFFEGANLLNYPELDGFNSDFYTISLRFVLMLYCPLLPKKVSYLLLVLVTHILT